MAINPARLRIPYTNEAFPAGTIPNISSELSVTWDEIIWAALTIGRPSLIHVFQHGASSHYEAIFRASIVRMALEQYGPSAIRLRRTSAFKHMDPTEKGAVNYFLGMVFCKIFSTRLLDTPWLLHLDIYKSVLPLAVLGRSRPDLFGQQNGTARWRAFESKGRASKPSVTDRAKAKAQALRLLSVGGTACDLHVGSFTYFASDVLRFHWIDPPPEPKQPLALPTPGEAWRYYYEPIRALWADSSVERKGGEITIPLPDLDLRVRVHPLLAPYFFLKVWERAQREMSESYERLLGDGFQSDGLRVECGPSWKERRFEGRQAG